MTKVRIFLWVIQLIDNGGELACISHVHACLNSGRYLINLGAQDGLITFLLLGSRTEKETSKKPNNEFTILT